MLLNKSVVYVDCAYIHLNVKEDEHIKNREKPVWCLPLPDGKYDRVEKETKREAEDYFVKKYIPKWNHAFDIGFAVYTNAEEPFDADPQEIIDGLERRLNELKDNPEMVKEAIGYYNDSYDNHEQ